MNIIHVLVYLIIIVILVNFIRKRKHKRFYQLLEQFPSIPTYPLIGNTHLFFMAAFEDLLATQEKILKPYDRLIFWMGPIPILCLKKHDDIATILNQCHNRDTLGLVEEWLGVGILGTGCKITSFGTDEEWKKSKKLIAPAFNSDMLAKYTEIFNENSLNLVEKLKRVADTGEQIDVWNYMMVSNLESTAETVLGISFRNSEKKGQEFCKAVLDGFKHGARRLQWPWLLSRYVNKIYLKISGNIKSIDHIKHLPTEVLRRKLKNYENFQNGSNADDEENDSSEAMVDLIIKHNSKESGLTEERIRNELLQTIIAGVETTALITSFLMLMLAMNQDIQEKVYEEVIQQTSDNERLSVTQLNNGLEYMEKCVKETLRMFSPVVVTTRRTHKEIILKDTIVPKDIYVASFIYIASYDPDLYENPEKWDPEHFSDEAVEQRPKTGVLSFGFGPRSCIGSRYSLISIKAQITHILRNYHLSTDIKEFTKKHLTGDLGMKSKIGYPIKFTSRRKR